MKKKRIKVFIRKEKRGLTIYCFTECFFLKYIIQGTQANLILDQKRCDPCITK